MNTRKECLEGKTYKLVVPQVGHAYYITINDGENGLPFEIFINSRNMENFAWIVALSRLVSMIFRIGGKNVDIMIEELSGTFDPKGGYFRPGGKYMESMIAEIGLIIKSHIKGNI